jgi:hypothetical protein
MPSPVPFALLMPFSPSLLRLHSPFRPCLRACLSPGMGRKFNQELVAQTKDKGYQRGVHKEKDEVRNRHKHVESI